jgi:crotonobetainyl-CoA:carnitine CoA-transferase CaiB-like acyl-CoA transferase
MDTLATARPAFSLTTRSSATTAGYSSAPSAGRFSTGCRRFEADPNVYTYDACSKDAAAVNSEKGKELDRRLREYCAARSALEVETALNKARIGCARVYGTPDQYADEHYRARDMTVPVLDRQSGVPVRVYGVVPKMSLTPGRVWRGAPAVGEDTTDILSTMLGLKGDEIARLYEEQVVHRTEPFTEPQVEAIHP